MKIEIGQVYKTNEGGSVTVINYIHAEKVLVQHNDDYKHEQFVQSSCLRAGVLKNPYRPSVKGVGFIGSGKFPRSIMSKPTKPYALWASMINRCYCEKRNSSKKSLSGISVDKEWHNFQNFALWLDLQENGMNPDFDLDKDLRVPGNKIYSKYSCSMVPREINKMVKSMSGYERDLPQGVKIKGTHFESYIGMNGSQFYLGRYQTAEDASKAYKDKKQEYFVEMAEKHKNVIHADVYTNLTTRRIA
jgi:hypothetical protein